MQNRDEIHQNILLNSGRVVFNSKSFFFVDSYRYLLIFYKIYISSSIYFLELKPVFKEAPKLDHKASWTATISTTALTDCTWIWLPMRFSQFARISAKRTALSVDGITEEGEVK